MMFCNINFKTKKALKDAVAKGKLIGIHAQGIGHPKTDGKECIWGPHFPEPHKWYAEVSLSDGIIIKVE